MTVSLYTSAVECLRFISTEENGDCAVQITFHADATSVFIEQLGPDPCFFAGTLVTLAVTPVMTLTVV